jgi:hypothetical protein
MLKVLVHMIVLLLLSLLLMIYVMIASAGLLPQGNSLALFSWEEVSEIFRIAKFLFCVYIYIRKGRVSLRMASL